MRRRAGRALRPDLGSARAGTSEGQRRFDIVPQERSHEAEGGYRLPITARQTVIALARSRPNPPQSHVQKRAATSSPVGEMPVLLP